MIKINLTSIKERIRKVNWHSIMQTIEKIREFSIKYEVILKVRAILILAASIIISAHIVGRYVRRAADVVGSDIFMSRYHN